MASDSGSIIIKQASNRMSTAWNPFANANNAALTSGAATGGRSEYPKPGEYLCLLQSFTAFQSTREQGVSVTVAEYIPMKVLRQEADSNEIGSLCAWVNKSSKPVYDKNNNALMVALTGARPSGEYLVYDDGEKETFQNVLMAAIENGGTLFQGAYFIMDVEGGHVSNAGRPYNKISVRAAPPAVLQLHGIAA